MRICLVPSSSVRFCAGPLLQGIITSSEPGSSCAACRQRVLSLAFVSCPVLGSCRQRLDSSSYNSNGQPRALTRGPTRLQIHSSATDVEVL